MLADRRISAEARKALDIDPNFLPAYLCLADVHVGMKNYHHAVADT